jgi:hypothetical protein
MPCLQIGKGAGRHVRMADNVLAAADQFVAVKARHLDKSIIGVSDHALEVGFGDDGALRERLFVLCDR